MAEKKYRLLSTIANPEHVYSLGDVVTMDEEVAQKYITDGKIEEYKGGVKSRGTFDYEKAVNGVPFEVREEEVVDQDPPLDPDAPVIDPDADLDKDEDLDLDLDLVETEEEVIDEELETEK